MNDDHELWGKGMHRKPATEIAKRLKIDMSGKSFNDITKEVLLQLEYIIETRSTTRARLERLEKRFLEIAEQLEKDGMPVFAAGIRDVIEDGREE